MNLKIENGLKLYAASMGKLFRVRAICETDAEANAICERHRELAVIATDSRNRVYMAEQYGAVCPSAIMDDVRRRS